jgi:Zn ribbon nucleic-acid-binding protein
MKILLRNYDGKYYVWKDARWENGSYFLIGSGMHDQRIYMNNIIAIKEDDRIGYVRCNNCGELIKNTPEDIEAHFALKEKEKDCLKCGYVRLYGDKYNKKIVYTKNDDNTYSITETYDSALGCSAGYWTHKLGDSGAERDCIHTKCRRYGVSEINDIFIKYDNPFDKHITVDFLREKKFVCEGYIGDHWEYDLKCRGSLKACVNELGIVDKFKVYSRGYEYYAYYSARHNKLFFDDGYKYSDHHDDYVGASKHDMILTKLSKLFEEANTNE